MPSLSHASSVPAAEPLALLGGLDFLWLEITGKCNLNCSHCYADSAPWAICLQGLPQPQLGGDLELEGEPVPLAAGDAMLFVATRLRHGTSRIGGARLHRSGYSRVVLVLRLFGGDPGHTAVPERPAVE